MCFVGLNRRKNHCAGVYFVASVAERLPTHLLEPFASVVGYRLLDEHTVGQYVAVLIACYCYIHGLFFSVYHCDGVIFFL